MFALVNDVESYARRFDWCMASEVVSRGENEMLARLDVKVGGMRVGFSTRNVWVPDQRIDIALAEGPFRALSGVWRFDALAEDASKVSLTLDFEVAGRLVGGALASGFRGLADRMVDDFVRAARQMPPAA